MKLLLTLSGLMLLYASVAAGAGTLIGPRHLLSLPEPGGLLILGIGFVLLANRLRRKPC